MRRMPKPDPVFRPDAQDKRSVIPIEAGDVDQWLAGTVAEAQNCPRFHPHPTGIEVQPPQTSGKSSDTLINFSCTK